MVGTFQEGATCPKVQNECKNLICFGKLNKDEGDYHLTEYRTEVTETYGDL